MKPIITLVKTSSMFPSQWEGLDADGVYYYIRYRHGCLDISRSAVSMSDAVAKQLPFGSECSLDEGNVFFSWEGTCAGGDGIMTFAELMAITSEVLEFSEYSE